MSKRKKTSEPARTLCLSIVEVLNQADADLCGEQRAYHLPRLRKAFAAAAELFPHEMVLAMEEARDAWGQPICEDDDPAPASSNP